MVKQCCHCEEEKPLSEFSKNKSKKDGHNNKCKPCMREYNKKYFKTMSRERKDKKNEYKRNLREEMMKNILDYLDGKSCVDCGYSNPIALDFDHMSDKSFAIADVVGRYTWDTIKSEINKCEIRCANCHRIKTAVEFNFIKVRLLGVK